MEWNFRRQSSVAALGGPGAQREYGEGFMLTIRSRWPRRVVAVAVSVAPLLAALIGAPAASAAWNWAPAESATIHPGVTTVTDRARCTSDFVFTDRVNVYLGQAAHCSSTSDNTTTDGCQAQSLPLGTPVRIGGASQPGTLAYSSWLAMRASHEADPNACAFNDLALVKIDPADIGSVNPSIPFWGGPVGLNATGTAVGQTVVAYSSTGLRRGPSASPKQGVSLGDTGSGWSHQVATVPPGIPGDSGSAYLDAEGNGVGVLSTLELAPRPGTNGVGDLGRELTYQREHSSLGRVRLVLGTESFRGPLSPSPSLSPSP